MVKTSVLYKKASHLRYNLDRLKEKQPLTEAEFLANKDVREAVLLNLQQAIQACVDIGTHIVSEESWGVPGSFSEIFYKLEEHKIIPTALVEIMIPMVGFRNLIVHQYDEIDYKIVYQNYQKRLADFESYLDAIQASYPP